MKNILVIVFALLLLHPFCVQAQNNTDVMLQGFNWESHSNTQGWYNVIKSKATDLGASQIDMVWFPPSSRSAAVQGYLPNEYYDLDTPYGTQAELQAAIQELSNHNVKSIADIVINHRVGTANWADFTNPTWGCWAVTAGDEWGYAGGGNPCGNNDTGDGYEAARDIDHTNETVQNDIKDWMNWLKNTIGFAGWRFDYTKGYSGYYNGIYNDATSPYFAVGELWDNLDEYNPDPHRQQIIDWVNAANATASSFDFTTKGVLQRALYDNNLNMLNRNGQAPGVIGWWPEKAVTFLDNHDTGSTQAHWPFPDYRIMEGYAYILTHPGVPSVFWDHFYEWGLHDQIKELIAIRKANDIHSGSNLAIQQVQNDLYSAIIDGKVAMKIGGGNWSPAGSGWELKASGNGYAVWDKLGNEPTPDTTPPTLSANPPSGTITSPTTVTITATDDQDNAPTIYYTTDGSMPDQNSSSATTSFSVTASNTTIKAYAVDASGNESNVQTFSYVIGTQPTMTIKLKTTWGTPYIYYWGVDSPGSNGTTTWPGEPMVAEGDGWYAYTIEGSCANIIFTNNGASQTDDLSTCGDSWYDNAWVPEPVDNEPPSISVSPAGGNFPSGSVTVNISATDNADPNPRFYYTIDGSEPSASSANSTSAVSLTFTAETILKVRAVDNLSNVSSTVTHEYTFDPAPDGFTVYFLAPDNWNQVKMHHWNGIPSGVVANSTWPGVDMNDEGDGWYSYTFAGLESSNVIFHNNAGSQTLDLTREGDGWYMNGAWYDTDPTGPAGDMTVYFKPNTYSNPTVYFWGATPAGASTSWPGEAMTDEGNGWYSYTLSSTNCTNLIFSNNGASQTADLYRCGNGWYENGQWSNGNARMNFYSEEIINLSSAPNPAAEQTTISFYLPKEHDVTLSIMDMAGRAAAPPIQRHLWKGQHTFPINTQDLPAGIYFYQLKLGTYSYNRRLVVLSK